MTIISNLFCPIVITYSMGLSVFILPAEGPEKINLGNFKDIIIIFTNIDRHACTT